jgi:hypothetical protein
MQLDPAPWPGEPFPHELGMMIARVYCGQLGKRENCQVAVSLSLANHHANLPVAWRIYLYPDSLKSREKFLAVSDWTDSVMRMIQSGFLSEEDRIALTALAHDGSPAEDGAGRPGSPSRQAVWRGQARRRRSGPAVKGFTIVEGFTIKVDHGAAHAQQGASIEQVFQSRDGRLRTQFLNSDAKWRRGDGKSDLSLVSPSIPRCCS